MTLLEKFNEDRPTHHLFDKSGLPQLCPWAYYTDDYAQKPDYCPTDGSEERCGDCWNREIGEEALEDKKMIYAHIGPFGKEEESDTIDGKFIMATPIDGKTSMVEAQKLVNIPHILDSGARREFGTGAVRDIQEGKGRCDLLPLDVVCHYRKDAILGYIANFQEDGTPYELGEALNAFVEVYSERGGFKNDFDMLLEVSIHFEEGAKKYGESNWKFGIPVRCYIDSAVRHYLKFLRGDTDEPHHRAFAWNLMCAMWTCKHKPELNDYAKRDTSEVEKVMG